MRTILALAALVLVGCPKKEEAPEASTEDTKPAAEAAAPEAGGPTITAKNIGDITRFQGSEQTLDGQLGKTSSATVAKTAPNGGNAVASIKPGTDVQTFAIYNDCFLVSFLDPKSPADRLAGWIPKEAFSTPPVVVIRDAGAKEAGAADAGVADAGKPPLKCTAGQAMVTMGGDPVCKKKCATDADCKGGKGSCVAAAAAVGGKALHVCGNE